MFSGTTIPCEHFKTVLDSHCTQNKSAIFKLLILNNLELVYSVLLGAEGVTHERQENLFAAFFASTSTTRCKCLTL